MTITNPSNRIGYQGPGNGFAYPRPVFNDNDIYVEIITDQNVVLIPTLDGGDDYDFTVSGTFDDDTFRYPSGVTVTLNNALPSDDWFIVIENRVSPTQSSDYINGGPIPAERLETDLDRLAVMAQAPVSVFQDLVRVTPAAGIVLPPLIPQANRLLRWNSDGNAIENALISELETVFEIDLELLGEAANHILVYDGTKWTNESPEDARTALGLVIGTDVLAPDGDGSQLTGIQSVPTGVMLDYAGAGSVPDGYLLCDGSNVSRTTYAALFAVLGETWGVGDGATTFGLPDSRRRVSVGSGGTGTATLDDTVGSTGGEEAHTLTADEAPVMSAASSGAHTHNITSSTSTSGTGAALAESSTADSNRSTGSSGAHTHTVNSGGGGSHNVMQPSYVVQKIIKT